MSADLLASTTLAADGPSLWGWIVVVVILLGLAAVLMAVLRRGRAGGAVSPIDQPRAPQPPDDGPPPA